MEYGLSLGSNLGDRLANLTEARRRIAALPDTRVVAVSPVYETEPVDVSPQFQDVRFLNAAVAVESEWAPERMNTRLHAMEGEMGRVRGTDRNAPRPVDIDIIYADGLRLHSDTLTVPHRRWAERRFVVQPLCDIRPDLVISPGEGTVRDILLSLPKEPGVVRFTETW